MNELEIVVRAVHEFCLSKKKIPQSLCIHWDFEDGDEIIPCFAHADKCHMEEVNV